MDEKTLGELCYEAYVTTCAGKSLVTGDLLPKWDEQRGKIRDAWEASAEAVANAVLDRCEQPPDGGQWMRIAFMGHVELTGYVTEVTIGGQAAFRVDLPEKLWGGNPMAWREYAATALYSREPVSEESVRKRWESQRAARLAWEERERRYELEAAKSDEDPCESVLYGDEDPF